MYTYIYISYLVVICPYAHTHALQMAEDMIRNGAVHQRSLMLRLCSRLPRFRRLSRRPCPAFLPPSGSLVRFPPPIPRSLSLSLCILFSVSLGWLACLLTLLCTLPVRSCTLSHALSHSVCMWRSFACSAGPTFHESVSFSFFLLLLRKTFPRFEIRLHWNSEFLLPNPSFLPFVLEKGVL